MTLLPPGVKVHLAFGYTGHAERHRRPRDAGPGRAAAGSLLGPPVRIPGSQSQSHQDRILGWDWAVPIHQAARARCFSLASECGATGTLSLTSAQLSMLIDGVD